MTAAAREPWAARRGRSTSMLLVLAGGALALIGSTQTWATTEVAGAQLSATGGDALSLLQPLTFAALALALAVTLAGRVLRYVLGAIAVVIGAALVALVLPIAITAPVSVVAAAVTEHTGIAGDAPVADLVGAIALTPWPGIVAACGALVVVGGVLILATAHAWRRGGRRFEQGGAHATAADGEPLDAVDSWDDLSRGDDPTRPAA
ncbi:Trp biosynthesis-associated membrane protein [Microbacterium indicum]|uniref:Trp biosynthesis-associated membrane protein n=1 Tax=Microbacterium indicum TaxID=358100 RepID=UPI00048F10B0|nr:Trp biosynthesis-associated membrane protein [Microbacterium indicum]